MQLNGFAGYPLVNGIPRGSAFVDFVRSRPASSAGIARPTAPSPSGAGGSSGSKRIDYTLEPSDTTVTQLPDKGSLRQRQTDKVFADGSNSRGIRTDYPDGSARIDAVRRSTPGADGIQAINVREVIIAPDGTQTIRARVFHVANGADAPGIEGAAGAKEVYARDRTLLADRTVVSDTRADDIRDERPPEASRNPDQP